MACRPIKDQVAASPAAQTPKIPASFPRAIRDSFGVKIMLVVNAVLWLKAISLRYTFRRFPHHPRYSFLCRAMCSRVLQRRGGKLIDARTARSP